MGDIRYLLKVGLVVCIGIFPWISSLAQSPGTLLSHTYDTVLVGNGLDSYIAHFPQWRPDSGTLKAVKVTASTSSQYAFTLSNASPRAASYSLTLGEEAQLTGTGISSPLSGSTSRLINSYQLMGSQGDTVSPFAFLKDYPISDSITKVGPFQGTGQVSFNFSSFTYTNLTTPNGDATYSYSSNIANTTHLSIQYLFVAPTPAPKPADSTKTPAPAPPADSTGDSTKQSPTPAPAPAPSDSTKQTPAPTPAPSDSTKQTPAPTPAPSDSTKQTPAPTPTPPADSTQQAPVQPAPTPPADSTKQTPAPAPAPSDSTKQTPAPTPTPSDSTKQTPAPTPTPPADSTQQAPVQPAPTPPADSTQTPTPAPAPPVNFTQTTPAPAPTPLPPPPPAATLVDFTATLGLPHVAVLNWGVTDDSVTRSYDVQRSTDSRTFTTINNLKVDKDAQTADYNYTDNMPDSLAGIIYYRLQIHNGNTISFSQVQQVNVGGGSGSLSLAKTDWNTPMHKDGFNIYPNPATTYIDINTDAPAGDWQVEILSTNGTVVQRAMISASTILHIPFTSKLAFGTYFVRMSDRQGHVRTGSFVIIEN